MPNRISGLADDIDRALINIIKDAKDLEDERDDLLNEVEDLRIEVEQLRKENTELLDELISLKSID